MACEKCDDGEGSSIFPMYGVAPHTCYYKIQGAVIGESVEIAASLWPANFELDESDDGPGVRCGVYTHCLHCGAGDMPPASARTSAVVMAA